MAVQKYNKAEYIEQQESLKNELENKIKTLAESFKEKPEVLADTLKFGSHFYHYSGRNTMLIYGQNKYVTFVDSFKALKDKGYNVQKGEKGMKILVPVKTTYLKIGNELVKLSAATKEQKADYKAVKNQSMVKSNYKIGTVFDISQTDCPTTDYPKLYHMGYESEQHDRLYRAVKNYVETILGAKVIEHDISSISLRGYYQPDTNTIYISEKLKDTEKLSTLVHELGHAELHTDIMAQNKPISQIEFEADSISIMLQQKLGLPITEGRQRHLHNHYIKMENGINKNIEKIKQLPKEKQAADLAKTPTISKVINNVFEHYKGMAEAFEQTVDNSLNQQKQLGQDISHMQQAATPVQAAVPEIEIEMQM